MRTYTIDQLATLISLEIHVDKLIARNTLLAINEICEKYLFNIDPLLMPNPRAPKWFTKRHRTGAISKRKISKLINAANPQKGTTNE